MFDHDLQEAADDVSLLESDDDSEFFPTISTALRPKPRPVIRPLPRGAFTPNRPGVDSAVLNTPGGSATVRLPEKVVTQEAFREATQKLEATINNLASQLNATRTDLSRLTQGDSALELRTRRALSSLRKSNQSQAMMGMLMAMMAQRDVRSSIDSHRHVGSTAPVDPQTVSGDNSMMMMLPMMMMGNDDYKAGSGDSSMMMMVMMMAMGRR
jgi:hypothetical protein